MVRFPDDGSRRRRKASCSEFLCPGGVRIELRKCLVQGKITAAYEHALLEQAARLSAKSSMVGNSISNSSPPVACHHSLGECPRTAAAGALLEAFLKAHKKDSMPRMTLAADPTPTGPCSWAPLSTDSPIVNQAAVQLCDALMRSLAAKVASPAPVFGVLATLACGRSGNTAVEWLLDHAVELARAAEGCVSDEESQFHAVACIHNLVYTEQGAERLATGGVIDVPGQAALPRDRTKVEETTKMILASMGAHTSSERLQNCGLLFCRNLTSHYEGQDAMLEIGLPPVLHAVVTALRFHSKSERLQIHGVSCLKYLTEPPPWCVYCCSHAYKVVTSQNVACMNDAFCRHNWLRDRLLFAHAFLLCSAEVVVNSSAGILVIQTLIETMRLHMTCLSVLERAVAFLKNVTWAETNGCTAVLEQGGITVLLEAMVQHPHSEAVQEGGVHVLRNLCMTVEGETALLEANSVPIVLDGLSTHQNCTAVVLHAMSFFKHVADSDDGAEALLSCDGIIALLLLSVGRHPENVDVQQRGLSCLLNLVFDLPGLSAVVSSGLAPRLVEWALPLALDVAAVARRAAAEAEANAIEAAGVGSAAAAAANAAAAAAATAADCAKISAQLLMRIGELPVGRQALLQSRHMSAVMSRTGEWYRARRYARLRRARARAASRVARRTTRSARSLAIAPPLAIGEATVVAAAIGDPGDNTDEDDNNEFEADVSEGEGQVDGGDGATLGEAMEDYGSEYEIVTTAEALGPIHIEGDSDEDDQLDLLAEYVRLCSFARPAPFFYALI